MNSRYLTESWAEQRTHCTPNIRGSAHWWWHFRAGFEVYPPGIDFDSGLKMGIPWNGNLCRENHLNTIKNWTRFFVDACFFLEKTYTTLYNHQWWQPLNMENESRMIKPSNLRYLSALADSPEKKHGWQWSFFWGGDFSSHIWLQVTIQNHE